MIETINLPKTKEERIKHYRLLIKRERSSNYVEGICIALGNICGGYGNVPWTGWTNLIEYYPELIKYRAPTSLTFSHGKRKKVIESLNLRINKKADIYYK